VSSVPTKHHPTRRAVLLAAASLTLAAPAWAADSSHLDLVVDSRQLQVGQTITVQLQLTNASFRGQPELPVESGLQARFSGQSSQHIIENMKSTRITAYSFAVSALTAGTWKVGPVSVELGGRTLTAPAVEITVAPRDAASAKSQDVLATISDPQPYLGEVVVYRFRHQHSERLLDLNWTPPAFDGFIAEKMADAGQREYQIQQDGTTYGIEEISIPLVASAAGRREIPPAVVSAKVPAKSANRRRNPFMASVDTLTLASQPISVEIRPLPTEGRPADFSGLVGSFRLDAVARREGSSTALPPGQPVDLPLGESLTLEITLAGTGTLAGVRLPDAPPDKGYRAYDDSPEITASVEEGRLSSVATFRRAVVPSAEGSLTVEPVELVVFDPDAERYLRLKTDPITLRVTPGEAADGQVRSFGDDGGQAPDQRQDVETLAEDILPVPGDARVRDRSLRSTMPWALSMPALPAVGLVALAVEGALRRRRPDPRALLRRALQDLPTDPTARLGALESAFRDACGLRLSRPAPGLTRDAVATLGDDAAALYDDLGRARYGGFEPGGDLETRVRRFVEGT